MSNSPTPQFANYFELFDQSVGFVIDEPALSSKFTELQRQYHPDNAKNNSPEQASSNDASSALINTAYQTLLHPDSRAEYLLQLAGQPFDNNRSIADESFLQTAMMHRMDMEEASSISDLKPLIDDTKRQLENASTQFADAYANQDWELAVTATQKLKFLQKLKQDMMAKERELTASVNDSDDDLYL